ncbi:MAG: hypothetical protein VX756_07660 [Bacteroidota bacterium]|nr:hypothetical protein [Bacteroidota bacterium]
MKKIVYILLLITLPSLTSLAQKLETAGIVSIYTQGIGSSDDLGESLYRIEVTKTEKFNVLDRLDMMEIIQQLEVDPKTCYGKKCMLEVGKTAKVDKIISGSIENLGKKIVITVKILDVESEDYDKIVVQEFINLDEELQLMVQITINKALGIENDPVITNNLIYYNQPPQSPTTYIKNNGPRMGVAIVGGEMGTVLTAPENRGGYGMQPIVSQIGYQFEGAYLSAGNFQALIEGLILFSGIEQNMFNPSFTFINGFRSSKNGWEFGFGPTFRMKRVERGYYLYNSEIAENWRLTNEWEGTSPNPYDIVERIDKRGNLRLSAGWTWALGKTFHSGYLNIPVNLFLSHSNDGWYSGLSVGFNIAKK